MKFTIEKHPLIPKCYDAFGHHICTTKIHSRSVCFDIVTLQNFCSKILIHFYKQRFYVLLTNLYEFSAGTFFLLSPRTENTEKLCALSERKPLFVQRKSILVLTPEVRKLHMDKITSQARTNLSIALQILIGSMSDREKERARERDIYIYVYIKI